MITKFNCTETDIQNLFLCKTQRDYIKWRGMLFHRFLLALVDDSEKISQLARYVFGSILKCEHFRLSLPFLFPEWFSVLMTSP